MIFKKASEIIETQNKILAIKNMELSSYHWNSVKELKSLLENIELLLPLNKDNINEFLTLMVGTVNDLPRINSSKFYRDGQAVYMANFTDIDNMGSLEPFQRSASVLLKKLGDSFTIIEFTRDQVEKIEKNELKLPETWKLDEELTKKFTKYKKAFSVWE